MPLSQSHVNSFPDSGSSCKLRAEEVYLTFHHPGEVREEAYFAFAAKRAAVSPLRLGPTRRQRRRPPSLLQGRLPSRFRMPLCLEASSDSSPSSGSETEGSTPGTSLVARNLGRKSIPSQKSPRRRGLKKPFFVLCAPHTTQKQVAVQPQNPRRRRPSDGG